jgi:hypothetical protein
MVHMLDSGPAPGLDIAPQFIELVLRLLVESGDTGIDGSPAWGSERHRDLLGRKPTA